MPERSYVVDWIGKSEWEGGCSVYQNVIKVHYRRRQRVKRNGGQKKKNEEKKSGACLLSLPRQQTPLEHAFYTRCPIFRNMHII